MIPFLGAQGAEYFHFIEQGPCTGRRLDHAIGLPGNACRFEVPMGQVEQLITHFAFLAKLGDEAAGHVFGHGFAGLFQHRFRCRVE
ncbi:hypothetical protein D9M72_628310 [compost metagenome]